MEVNDYVRTKDGRIYKIGDIGNFIYSKDDVIIQGIIKSSPNIIDLIEENDYIRIITDTDFRRVYNSYGKLVIYRESEIEEIPIENFSNKFIGGVITSEQIESMEYKVKE